MFLIFFLIFFTFNSYAKNIVPIEKPNIKLDKDGSVVFLKDNNKNIVPHDKPIIEENKTAIKKIAKKTDNAKSSEINKKYVFSGTTTEQKNTPKKDYKIAENSKIVVKNEPKKEKIFVINNDNFKNNNEKDNKQREKLIAKNDSSEKLEKNTKEDIKQEEVRESVKSNKEKSQQKTTNKKEIKDESKQKNKKLIVISNDNFEKNNGKEEITQKQNYTLTSNSIESDTAKENNYNEATTILTNKFNMKPATKVVKSTNYSTAADNNINIINKIEQNLLYGSSITKKTGNNIEIKRGSWSDEDLKEVETKKKFEITKTSRNVDMMSKETEKNNKIASLKDDAYQAVKLGEYEIAVKLYKEILALNNKDNFTKLSLATTYHVLGQYVQAKPLYIELLPVFPNSEQLISNLLSIIIQESPYEAIYLLPALAEKYSNSPVIQAQTSVAFSTVERYNDAIKYIKNAIYLDEGNVEYKYNLAVLYDATKQYEKAYKVYQDVANYVKNNQVNSISLKRVEERIKQIKKLI